MNALLSQNTASWSATHPTTAEDKVAMAAQRAMVEPLKGKLQGTAARPPFDAITERVPAPKDVSFEADTVGGISGWWCRPSQAKSEHVILHLHGGWFNWGSAQAFRHLVGHIAASAGRDHPRSWCALQTSIQTKSAEQKDGAASMHHLMHPSTCSTSAVPNS
jgi:acetyl esterase/lipase